MVRQSIQIHIIISSLPYISDDYISTTVTTHDSQGSDYFITESYTIMYRYVGPVAQLDRATHS